MWSFFKKESKCGGGVLEHSKASDSVTDTGDANPNLGFPLSVSSSTAGPGTIPSDQTVELRKQLGNRLYLKEIDDKDKEASPYLVVEEEAHEKGLKNQHLILKDVEVDKHSIGWNQDEDFNSGESNGGYDEHSYDDDKSGNEVEKNDERSNGNSRHQYPVRPEAEDCSYYMKTGTCKFGFNCKFNHPVRRKNQAAKEKVKEREEAIERPGQKECKYYLRTGGCKYGKACRYHHSKANASVLPAKTSILPVSDLNFLGLPIRPGERECPYYMRNGSCKYGTNCRFNHPDPTAVGGSDPPSAFNNGGSASLQSSSQSNVALWSSPRGISDAPSFVPIMFPPTQGVPSQSPEWNGYQAPIYPPERSIHPAPAYIISPATDTNVYTHQQQISVDEFPERPGQPECSYYLKTGDCKFKSSCKYHHPKKHISKSPPCALSDKGLPLRAGKSVCSYYSRYGICKFGPSCKFDHPILLGSTDDQSMPFADSVAQEEARMAETGNGSDNAIKRPM